MEDVRFLIAILIAAAIMWPSFQWYTWYHRAVITSHEARACKAAVDNMQQQFSVIADERKLHHETIENAFDFVNEDDSWGARDVSRRELRTKLMDVLKDSSVGRV